MPGTERRIGSLLRSMRQSSVRDRESGHCSLTLIPNLHRTRSVRTRIRSHPCRDQSPRAIQNQPTNWGIRMQSGSTCPDSQLKSRKVRRSWHGLENHAVSRVRAATAEWPELPVVVADGRYEESSEWARKAIHRQPNYPNPHYILAIGLAHMDRTKEAQAALDQCERIQPGFVGSRATWRPYKNSASNEHILDGLRKAGLK